mgnify:CR=1 FL=1
MSGNDSGSIPSGSGAASGASTTCESLAFESFLSSPKPTIVALLNVGDVLDITVQTTGGIETVAVLYQGQVAGGLVQNSDRIKACISQGFNYQADVRGVQGAQITIFVHPA